MSDDQEEKDGDSGSAIVTGITTVIGALAGFALGGPAGAVAGALVGGGIAVVSDSIGSSQEPKSDDDSES